MFYSGDLQTGIGLAVAQRKAVLCFVHDDSQQSTDWENVLASGSLAATTIAPQAIMLKIRAGSQEAALLSPFCAIDSIPAIIVVKNAVLEANIQANHTDADQVQSLLQSLFGSPEATAPTAAQQEATAPTAAQQEATAPTATQQEATAPTATQQEATIAEQPPASTSASSSSSTSTPASSTVYLALPSSDGQFRLPNNAYDALREHTQVLLHQGISHKHIYQTQLRLLERLPILRNEVRHLRSVTANPTLSDYARDKLLRMPGAAVKAQLKVEASSAPASSVQQATVPDGPTASASQNPPPGGQHLANASAGPTRGGEYVYLEPDSTQLLSETEEQSRREAEAAKKRSEREAWNRQQRNRQQQDRQARDRIKAEIAADREERRRLAELRSQNERIRLAEIEAEADGINRQAPQNASGMIRVQVRSLDGSVLRGNFKHDATIAGDIRPYVDDKTGSSAPYNLKLILTPLPNRKIEAGEEDMPLSDLGIKGSCTLVMVPVKGYVESYSDGSPGLVRSVLGLGYGLASGAAETVWGVGRYVLGYNSSNQAPTAAPQAHERDHGSGQQPTGSTKVRVRTLADQRAEERDRRGGDNQLYNGNQLNFEPNPDDDDDRSKRD